MAFCGASIAATGVLSFLLIVAIEHVVNRSLNPATHEISEYVHTSLGWLMTAGFAMWAVSVVATAVLAHSRWRTDARCIALFAAALGIGLTTCFATQTSAGRLPPGVSLDTSGRLHDIGSGLATAALFVAALLSLRVRHRPSLRRATVALLALAAPGDAVLLALGSDVAGIRQRLLVVIACVWQLALLMLKDEDHGPPAQSR